MQGFPLDGFVPRNKKLEPKPPAPKGKHVQLERASIAQLYQHSSTAQLEFLAPIQNAPNFDNTHPEPTRNS